MEAMLVNVALTGKRAGMEPKAISSKADSYYYHYYSFFFPREIAFKYYRQIEPKLPCAFQLISRL